MSRRWWWLLGALAVALVALLGAGGYSMAPSRSPKVSETWSRGLRVGTAIVPQPPALALAQGDGAVYLAWSARGTDRTAIRFARLDRQGRVVVDRMLSEPFFLPREPHLLVDGSGRLHLLCLARGGSHEPDGVFHLLLSEEGEALSSRTRLSGANDVVTTFQAALDAQGEVLVFWAVERGDAPGVHFRRLASGTPEGTSPVRLVSEGAQQVAALEENGRLHLAWLRAARGDEWEIRYASFPDGRVGPTEGQVVGTFYKSLGTLLQRPAVGVDGSHVYIFWSVEYRSGLSAGGAETDWVSFPIGHPEASRFAQVQLPGEYRGLPMRNAPTPLWKYRITETSSKILPDLIELPPEGVSHVNGYVYMPAVAPQPVVHLPVLLSVMVEDHMRNTVQPVLALFSEGELVAYQQVAQTQDFSLYPALAVDAAGDLHAAWVDQVEFGRYDVFYATTAADAMAWLDRLDAADVVSGLATTIWGMVSGLTLVPLVVTILVLPVLWLGAYYVLGAEDDLHSRSVQAVLAVAVVLYLLVKFLVLSPMLAQAPLLDRMSGALAMLWYWAVPLAVVALAALVVFVYARRSARASLFGAFFVFALSDTLLTLMVYGPSLFGR